MVLTQTYYNGYYIASFLCMAGVAIALTMKSARESSCPSKSDA
ncbi:MAG: hypothetical protein JWN67_335, partial [Actinomycetia bacterium]|nr:hypothetical protein [Actinomycetes bacterium]